ncbi:MAG: LysM peptidoglycan-binding domain-containing protein [Anaerolineales bacterium]|nr:LysM peptidoglycan-binding domain-containing protein [Anaerolineales bacterium]
MHYLISSKLVLKILLPLMTSAALVSQVLTHTPDTFVTPENPTPTDKAAPPSTPTTAATGSNISTSEKISVELPVQNPVYAFANPAGCLLTHPNLSPAEMLAKVQSAIGSEFDLAERRQMYIWNGEQGSMLNVINDPFVYEFSFHEFQHPLTYRGDKVATIFLSQGFVVWFREYGKDFRLLAIPMVDGVLESPWAAYVTAYWQKDAIPNDEKIYPVMKKLPCHWVIDAGYVSNETISTMFNLDWHIPDYMAAGHQYLAGTCKEANQISREKIGYWDASSMCGPLAWTILHDTNSFPYRIGSWSKDASAFTGVNPRWDGQPWSTFDPETFTRFSTNEPIASYDFEKNGNLYPGDIIYSFSTLYQTEGFFDHILLVASVNKNNTRMAVSNMVRNYPYEDCSIEEVALYTPGDLTTGAFNYEWNGHGFGKTGTTGFDVLRWNWTTYHNNNQPMQYTIRWGETIETIAFDWKISPESLLAANQLTADAQLTPGQVITLPAYAETMP